MATEAAILPVDFHLQGAAILQEQDTHVEPSSIVLSNKELFQAIGAFLKPYRPQIAIFMPALLLTAGITLSIGHGLRLIIDQGLVDTSLTSLNTAITFVIVAAILMAIGTSVRFY